MNPVGLHGNEKLGHGSQSQHPNSVLRRRVHNESATCFPHSGMGSGIKYVRALSHWRGLGN